MIVSKVGSIDSFRLLKTVADARRLYILRSLMAAPATLTQLGRAMEVHPAKVRYHLKKLESLGLVELKSTRLQRGFVEKYYQATAKAFYG